MLVVHVCITIPSLFLQLWQWNQICPVKFRSFVLQFESIWILFDFCDAGTTSKSSFDHEMYCFLCFFFWTSRCCCLTILGYLVEFECVVLPFILILVVFFCVTLGHLNLSFALKCIPFNHIHQTIYFISELPKMS